MGAAVAGTDDAGVAAFSGGAMPLSCAPLNVPVFDDREGRCSAGSPPVPGVIVGGEAGDIVGGEAGDIVGGRFMPGVMGVVGGIAMPPAGGV
jgi:hypothetical protein